MWTFISVVCLCGASFFLGRIYQLNRMGNVLQTIYDATLIMKKVGSALKILEEQRDHIEGGEE